MSLTANGRAVALLFAALWALVFLRIRSFAEIHEPDAQEASGSVDKVELPVQQQEDQVAEDDTSQVAAPEAPQFFISTEMLRHPAERTVQSRLVEDYRHLTNRVVRVRSLSSVELDPESPQGMISKFDYGTGVLVGSHGLILTAHHLIRNRSLLPKEDQEVAILTRESPGYLPVEVVAEDPAHDVAVLRAPQRFLPKGQAFDADLERQKPVEVGAPAYVIGIRADAEPDSFEVGVIEGRFVEASRQLVEIGGDKYDSDLYVCFSQRIFFGYSGGAILDDSGMLVGILVGAPYEGDQWGGFSLGIRINALETFMEEHP